LAARDQNRASVVVWSVANETPVTAERTRFLKTLVDTARSLDGSRLISAAMEVHGDKQNPDLFPGIAAVLQGRNVSLEYDALEIALAGHGFAQDLLAVTRQNRARLE